MTDPLGFQFRRPFPEQLAAFRLRLGNLVPTSAWDDLWQEQHDRAFMVAGATKAELLADLAAAVDKAIAEGTGIEAFRKDFRAIVEKHGWHGWTGEGTAKGEAWRTRVIYRTNLRTSYMAGRYAQLVQGGFSFWIYRHGGSLEPRIVHLGWDGLIQPPEHPFWAYHFPPNDWGCSCRVFGARTLAGAIRKGGKPGLKLQPGWDKIDPKTGAPAGIGKGWAYAPGASVAQTVAVAGDMLGKLPAHIGSDFGTSLEAMIERAWAPWVADTIVGGSHRPALLGVIGRQELDILEELGRMPLSAEVLVKPGLLKGPKAVRHESKGDALSQAEWASLPSRFKNSRAVLLDVESGNLLYLLDGVDGMPQLAVGLDYRMKGRKQSIANLVLSAYHPAIEEVRRRIENGRLRILRGNIG